MATIEVDDGILAALEARAGEKDFGNVEDYIRFVLEQLVRRVRGTVGEESLSEDEEKVIQEKLRSLGYLE